MHTRLLGAAALALALWVSPAHAQETRDIAPDALPAAVVGAVNSYLMALQLPDVNAAAAKALPVLGGSLLESTGAKLRTPVERFGLPKDHAHVAEYHVPARITHAQVNGTQADGDGAARVEGTWYKLWIGRKDGNTELAAPITVILQADGSAKLVTAVGTL